MRSWAMLLAGLLLWAGHFFLAYGIAEFAGSGQGARIAVMVFTVLALAGILSLAWRLSRTEFESELGPLRRQVGLAGLLIGGTAILWQGLPAILS